jgi:hypothetical protein
MSEPATPTPDAINARVPRPVPIKNPTRFSIMGKMHMIAELQQIVANAPGVDPEYKALILAELARVTTNAAQIDLHVVDHQEGTSIAIHIKPVKLG